MNKRKRFHYPLCVILVLISLWLVGCKLQNDTPPQETQPIEKSAPISFQSVAKGTSLTANLEDPIIHIACSPEELKTLAGWVDKPVDLEQISSVDFEQDCLLAVFKGIAPSSGYDISVQSIESVPGEVQVVVSLTKPGPGEASNAVETFPYHVIAISKENIPTSSDTTWMVYDHDGNFMARTVTPPTGTEPPKIKGSIPFESLARGVSFTAEQIDAAIFVAGNALEVEPLLSWMDDHTQSEVIRAVNSEQECVVAVMRGLTPSDAYGISIQSVKAAANEFQINVELVEPGQDSMGSDVESFPYHIISVPKDLVQCTDNAAWVMYDQNGELLASTTPAPKEPRPTEIQVGIPFESLAQGSSLVADVTSATVYIADSLAGMEPFIVWLDSPEELEHIRSVDFEENCVMAVFRGMAPSSAQGILVHKIEFNKDMIELTVEFTEPGPDIMGAAVESYPYHVIAIPKDEVKCLDNTAWILYNQQGEILAQSTD